MKTEAYLVLCIDAREANRAPRIVAAGVFSESAESLTLVHKTGIAYCDVYKSDLHDSYAEAVLDVHEFIRDHRWTWCGALLAEEWGDHPWEKYEGGEP